MKYNVDKNKKKQIIQIIRNEIGGKVTIPTFIYRVLFTIIFVLAIACIFVVCALAKRETDARWVVYLGGMLFIFCGSLILMIIPVCIRSYILRKYMMPWTGLKDEEILFNEDAIVYKFMNVFWQGYMESYWWTFKIRYKQVLRIEYDEKQRMLRIYGPKESRKWSDSKCTQCISKVGANPEWKDETWLEIPEYFENFDKIIAQIEERTGLKTINKVRPFETYK